MGEHSRGGGGLRAHTEGGKGMGGGEGRKAVKMDGGGN